jgi:hypothetical protein
MEDHEWLCGTIWGQPDPSAGGGLPRARLIERSRGRRARRGPRVVFAFANTNGKIVEIELLADPERLGHLDLTILS